MFQILQKIKDGWKDSMEKINMALKIILAILLFLVVIGCIVWLICSESSTQDALAGVFGGLATLLFIFVPFSLHQVDTGEVAVVREYGTIKEVKQPGLYFDGWLKNKYDYFDTKVKQIDLTTQAYTFDKQTVDLNFALQYQIDNLQVCKLAETYGTVEQVSDKIENVALDKIKAIFAQKTADQIIEDRISIVQSVKEAVNQAVNPETYYLTVKDIVLTNIDFTDDYEAAVAAKVAQKQALEKALIEQEQALKQAENDKKIAEQKASADAEVAKIQAEAAAEVARIQATTEAEVVKIQAEAAEFQGKKDAAIAMNKLAGVNGWYVVNIVDDDNGETTGYKLMKSDGSLVTDEELSKGVERLLEVYKYDKWDGKLPVYQMSDSGAITVVTP